MKTGIRIIIVSMLLLVSCAELAKLSEMLPLPLTESEVAGGLKEALITGTNNASGRLSAVDGYFGDAAIKILLPEEAKMIIDNISRIPGGSKLVDDVVLRINRAAEEAAKEMAPVFIGSIKQMTIVDAFNILNGPDDGATQYLIKTTHTQLYDLYKPKIESATRKVLVGGVSTKDSWDALTSKWNDVAGTMAGRLAGFKTVNTDLDDYLTTKALDGVFLKVAGEEYKIRKEVSARVTPALQRVFGSLDNK